MDGGRFAILETVPIEAIRCRFCEATFPMVTVRMGVRVYGESLLHTHYAMAHRGELANIQRWAREASGTGAPPRRKPPRPEHPATWIPLDPRDVG
jgi:hypothetical protein